MSEHLDYWLSMKHFIKRRKFLKLLLLGLGSLIGLHETPVFAVSLNKKAKQISFSWCELSSGLIHSESENLNKLFLPGSIMKLIAALSISEENLLSLNEELECRGHLTLRKEIYTCQKAHGKLNLMQALAQSCNCYFAQAAEKVSSKVFFKYAKQFFPRLGNIPLKAYSQNYILGLDESIKLSALEILQLTSIIATSGRGPNFCLKPNSQKLSPKLTFSQQTWNLLHAGMRAASQVGTAKKLDPKNILQIAAKTGTTLWGNRFQSWVVGFFPFKEPKYAFCLWSPVGSSQESAVPIAYEKLFARTWE